jgi:hypothetical protein
MSDEKGRIFERERRELGLTAEDYLRYLAQGQQPIEALDELLDEITDYTYFRTVLYDDLEHSGLPQEFGLDFDSFSSGDAAFTLVSPQQLIREIEGWDDPLDTPDELRPLILELAKHGASGALIAFSG